MKGLFGNIVAEEVLMQQYLFKNPLCKQKANFQTKENWVQKKFRSRAESSSNSSEDGGTKLLIESQHFTKG